MQDMDDDLDAPLCDVSWSKRATELYIAGDRETAMREIGPEHMALYHSAIMAGNKDPSVPRPGQRQWKHFLSFLQVEMEQHLGSPLDSAPPDDTGTTVTMTEVYDAPAPPSNRARPGRGIFDA